MKSWSYPYKVHYASLSDNIEMAYVDEGTGDVLLFIHGLGSNLKGFTRNIDSLKAQYRCIAIDLPGYGKSSQGDYSFSLDFFVDRIKEFMQVIAVEQAHMVGMSMGGQIAMMLALKYPELVEHLILIAPAGFESYDRSESLELQRIFDPDLLFNLSEAQIIKNFMVNFYKFPEDARFMIEDRLTMRASARDYEYFCNMVSSCVDAMINEPVLYKIQHIRHTTLVMFGEEDALIPSPLFKKHASTTSLARLITPLFPDARLHMIPEGGHFLSWEQAAAVNNNLKNFLK